MSWRWICIAARLKTRSPMKTANRIPTAGVVIQLAAKKYGKSSANGCGTSRLELDHQLAPDPVRTTEFTPALLPAPKETLSPSASQGYVPADVGLPCKQCRLAGRYF